MGILKNPPRKQKTIINKEDSFDKLVQDIKLAAGLSSQEATGFYAVYCPICGETHRKTGGFKFEGNDKIVYHCFKGKCDGSTVFTLGEPIPRKFKRLMEIYHIEIPLELKMIKKSGNFAKVMESLDESLYKKHIYKDIGKLDDFVEFDEGKKTYQEIWEEYFINRMCSLDDVLLCNKGKYAGYAAIRMQFYDKTIGYQIITPTGDYIKKFGGNDNVLYMPDGINHDVILVVEGTLDAKCSPNTVGTLQNRISPEQAYFLRDKDVIMLPDLGKKDNMFIKQFDKYGWRISIPDWGVKDLNMAVQKYGIIAAMKMVMEGVCKNKLEAELRFKMYG